jgi:hypothetical protein
MKPLWSVGRAIYGEDEEEAKWVKEILIGI